jgi:hypothetical protein
VIESEKRIEEERKGKLKRNNQQIIGSKTIGTRLFSSTKSNQQNECISTYSAEKHPTMQHFFTPHCPRSNGKNKKQTKIQFKMFPYISMPKHIYQTHHHLPV